MDKIYLLDPDGKKHELIRMGEKGDLFYGMRKNSTCGDCGVKMGEYHRAGCDLEQCPICGCQLISCDHGFYPVYNPRHGTTKHA